jgi:hypothetical protein
VKVGDLVYPTWGRGSPTRCVQKDRVIGLVIDVSISPYSNDPSDIRVAIVRDQEFSKELFSTRWYMTTYWRKVNENR